MSFMIRVSSIRPTIQPIFSISDIRKEIETFTEEKHTFSDAKFLVDKLKLFEKVTSLLQRDNNEHETNQIIRKQEKIADLIAARIQESLNNKSISTTTVSDKIFGDTLYQVLLSLAKVIPRNSQDPFLLDEISETEAVFISTRHQFDITSLVRWINEKQKFHNPFLGGTSEFSLRDQKTITDFAKCRGLNINLQIGATQPGNTTEFDRIEALLRQSAERSNSLGDFTNFEPSPGFNQRINLLARLAENLSLSNDNVMGSLGLAQVIEQLNHPMMGLGLFPIPPTPIEQENKTINETTLPLQSYGVTSEFIRENYQGRRFDSARGSTFIYLITGLGSDLFEIPNLAEDNRLTPLQAILEINNLDIDMVRALHQLYAFGLRGNHLRSWQSPDSNQFSFSRSHKLVLEFFLKDAPPDQRKTPEEAISMINRKTYSEARELFNSLSNANQRRSAMQTMATAASVASAGGVGFGPFSFFRSSGAESLQLRMIPETVSALQAYGVTEELIRENFHGFFDNTTKETLIYLITGVGDPDTYHAIDSLREGQRLTPIQALQEIDNLEGTKLLTLHELYASGLRGEHLRSWQPPEGGDDDLLIFFQGHCRVLRYYLKEAPESQRKTPMEAIAIINGKTDDEANEIWRSLTRNIPLRL